MISWGLPLLHLSSSTAVKLCVLAYKQVSGITIDTVIFLSSVLEHPHSARVSLISLLMVVLTEVPRESVIWYVIL